MLKIFQDQTYRYLFSAQIASLLGSGLTTVALGFLAFELAGKQAGQVLGTALAIKMLAYIFVSPLANVINEKIPRKKLLISLDLLRAIIVSALPFITEIWQIYVLIFILQSASAMFTPTFQAIIPEILPKEEDYTQALSLSRLAYDLENIISPMLAMALLTIMRFSLLFLGTAVGFLISAMFVYKSVIAPINFNLNQSFRERLTKGVRLYVDVPRLRGLMMFNFVIALAGAMVIINTVVFVQGQFSLSENDTALAFFAYGLGSMLAAVFLPKLLLCLSDRSVMQLGAGLAIVCLGLGHGIDRYALLIALWFGLGFATSLTSTPIGRLLKRSSNDDNRQSLFTAQFALSHLCWLFAYLLSGWLSRFININNVFVCFAVLSALSLLIASKVWKADNNPARS